MPNLVSLEIGDRESTKGIIYICPDTWGFNHFSVVFATIFWLFGETRNFQEGPSSIILHQYHLHVKPEKNECAYLIS